jgi:hypothetical protein
VETTQRRGRHEQWAIIVSKIELQILNYSNVAGDTMRYSTIATLKLDGRQTNVLIVCNLHSSPSSSSSFLSEERCNEMLVKTRTEQSWNEKSARSRSCVALGVIREIRAFNAF